MRVGQPVDGQLGREKRCEPEVRDPARQRFARLPRQRVRRRTQQEEATGAAVGIDLGAQRDEQLGGELHFVQGQQAVSVRGEKQLGLLKQGAIGGALEIGHQRTGMPGDDGVGQGGLADLTRPSSTTAGDSPSRRSISLCNARSITIVC